MDNLLQTWVAGNPGAAAWIISEAFSGHRDWRTEGDETLDVNTSGARLLLALRTWTDALGSLADGLLPSPVVRGPIALGVTVSGHRIDVAFSTSQAPADYVTEVPAGVHPLLSPGAVPNWRPWFSGGAPQGQAWPWTMVKNQIASATVKKLSDDPFLGTPGGIWVQERRFDLARSVLDKGSLFHGNLVASEVRQRVSEAFDYVGRDRGARISITGSTTYLAAELDDLGSWLDTTKVAHVASYLPEKDVPSPASEWVWNSYSPRKLMEFEAEVYGRACKAYDEAVSHAFARLGWSMPGTAYAPFGVLLEFRFDRGARLGDIPGLTLLRVPMSLISNIAPTGGEVIWSATGRAVAVQAHGEQSADWERHSAALETVRSWLAEQNREPIDGPSVVRTGPDDMSNRRPASSVAARWLYDDLKSLGLGTGTFPQLR